MNFRDGNMLENSMLFYLIRNTYLIKNIGVNDGIQKENTYLNFGKK